VPASALANPGTAQVVVSNPAPGGDSAALSFTIIGPGPAVSLSDSAVDFGTVIKGVSSATRSVTVTNAGGSDLAITSIAASGDFTATFTSGDFTTGNACGATLHAGNTCTVTLGFTPTATGVRTGVLTIFDNAPGAPHTVSLTGTAIAGVTIGTATGGSTTATISSGGTANYNLQITAASGFSGTVNLSCSGAPQGSQCSVSPASLTVAAGSTSSFTVSVTTIKAQSAPARFITAAGFGALMLISLPLVIIARRRSTRIGLCAVMLLGIGISISACGGGGSSSVPGGAPPPAQGTPAGTYSLTLTATSGTTTVTQNLTLVVQ